MDSVFQFCDLTVAPSRNSAQIACDSANLLYIVGITNRTASRSANRAEFKDSKLVFAGMLTRANIGATHGDGFGMAVRTFAFNQIFRL
jgi:hypothetical protein